MHIIFSVILCCHKSFAHCGYAISEKLVIMTRLVQRKETFAHYLLYLYYLLFSYCYCLITCVINFQMVDGHTLFDYSVGLNEIVQILIRAPVELADSKASSDKSDKHSETDSQSNTTSDKENEEVWNLHLITT